MKKIIFVGGVLLAALVPGYWLLSDSSDSATLTYQFGTVTRGDVEKTVSATGTVSPVTTVEVGTQVSGTIDTVMVDFNDPVKTDQVLAVLDRSLLRSTVLDAEATVERIEAQLEESRSEYDRNLALFNQQLISESVFLPYKVAVKTREAELKSANASLSRARRNLEYAVIRSPIDGIVIQRNVEAGQTVAASLSTPTLFIIAQDLAHMEILAQVDESDIGDIRSGQSVRFEVATYPEKQFEGIVSQIRLQPTTISNVVTYTVVVTADNPDGLLLPGMTATLDFVVDQRTDVLTVPARALTFRPSADIMQAWQERRRAERPDGADSTAGADMQARGNRGGGAGARSRGGLVWFIDSAGQVAAAPMRPGLSDGSITEVAGSRVLTEGMQVIIGSSNGQPSSTGTGNNRPPRGFGSGRF